MENNNKNNKPRSGGRQGRGNGQGQNKKSPATQQTGNGNGNGNGNGGIRKSSRGAAIRAQKRVNEDATRLINSVLSTPKNGDRPRANQIDDSPRLKVIGLGGMDGGGSKNMMLV